MREIYQEKARAHIDALMAYWTLAGLDGVVGEQPVNWLRPASSSGSSHISASANVGTSVASHLPSTPVEAFPDTLDAFHAWLADSTTLPESRWIGRRVLPTGPQAAPLMVILDVPDESDGTDNGILRAEADRLLTAILRAIGVDRNDAYVASLAVIRPVGGILDAEMLMRLSKRMRHHISLARPGAVLLLGDGTSRALDPTGTPSGSRYIPHINHDSGTIRGVATFHPRLMLNQPSAKAECWRALQQMIGDRAR